MGPGRREKKARATRLAIIGAARTLFERDGYAETTVDQIAEVSDISTRTFFRYFPNQEALLFAELDEARSAMLDALDRRPSHEDPLTSVATVFGEYGAVFEDRYDDLTWGFRMCEEFDMEGVYERSMIKQHSHERVAEFLADRMETDVDTDPRPMAIASAVMAVFGASIKSRVASVQTGTDSEPGSTARAFGSLLAETADSLATISVRTTESVQAADQGRDVVDP